MNCSSNSGGLFILTLHRALTLCQNIDKLPSGVVSFAGTLINPGNLAAQLTMQNYSVTFGVFPSAKYILTDALDCPAGYTKEVLECSESGPFYDLPGPQTNLLFYRMVFMLLVAFLGVMYLLNSLMRKPVIRSSDSRAQIRYFRNQKIDTLTNIDDIQFVDDRYQPKITVFSSSDSLKIVLRERETGHHHKQFKVTTKARITAIENEWPVPITVTVTKNAQDHPSIEFTHNKMHVKIKPRENLRVFPFGGYEQHASLSMRLLWEIVGDATTHVYDAESLRSGLERVKSRLDLTTLFVKTRNQTYSLFDNEELADDIAVMENGLCNALQVKVIKEQRLCGMKLLGTSVIIGSDASKFALKLLDDAVLECMCFMVSSLSFVIYGNDYNDHMKCVEKIITSDEYKVCECGDEGSGGLVHHSILNGESIICSVARPQGDMRFIRLKHFEIRNSIIVFDDPQINDVVYNDNGSSMFSVKSHDRYFALVKFSENDGYAIEYCPPETEVNVWNFSDDLDIAMWLINPQTMSPVWAVSTNASNSVTMETNSWKMIQKICHPAYLEEFRRSIEHVRNVRSVTLNLEAELKLSSSGPYRWYNVTMGCRGGSYICMVAESINEYKKQLSEFREAEEQMQMGAKYGNVIFWYFEDAMMPVQILSRPLGIQQTLHMNWSTVKYCVLEEWQDPLTRILKDSMHTGQPFVIEIPLLWEKFSWQSVRGVSTGRSNQYMGIAVDVTEIKEATFALKKSKSSFEEAVAAKTKFLRNISSALQAPLAGIIGVCQLLEHTVTEREQCDMVDVVFQSLTKLSELINDTLDLSMIEQNCLEIHMEKFSPRHHISTFRHFYKMAKQKGVLLTSVTMPSFPLLYYGEVHFYSRIIWNLLSNAIKFTKSGGVVSIHMIDLPDGSFEVRVTDTGIGISESDQELIYDLFMQGDSSITRPYGGIGVGLSLVKKMVDLLHGSIKLESKVGVGSTFTVVFPFEPLLYPYVPRTLKDKNVQILIDSRHPRRIQSTKVLTDFYNAQLISSASEIDYNKLVMIIIDSSEEMVSSMALSVRAMKEVLLLVVVEDEEDSSAFPKDKFIVEVRPLSLQKLSELMRTAITKYA